LPSQNLCLFSPLNVKTKHIICYSLGFECLPKTYVWKAWSPNCSTIGR
jgi:hypothetical protein